MTQNEKHAKTQKTQKSPKTVHTQFFFVQNRSKMKMEKIAFCVITFEQIKMQTNSAPQNDRLNFSFVKDIHVVGQQITRKGRKTAIYQSQILVISLYINSQRLRQFHEISLSTFFELEAKITTSRPIIL